MAYSGYKIYQYIDVNPKSPTFNTIREEKILESECSSEGSNWQEISSYCELDADGFNTGYRVFVEMDVNVDSPTYGQTRERREYNLLQCPKEGTEPDWVIDDDEEAYCEIAMFPSGLSGETGLFVITLIDDNDASPTYGQKRIDKVSESAWTEEYEEVFGEFPCEGVNTEPDVEVVSSECVLEYDEYGVPHTNGYERVTGIDKNPYSPTYLSAVTITRENQERCPQQTSSSCTFTFSGGGTSRSAMTEYSASSFSYGIISQCGGSATTFAVSEACDWLSYTNTTSSITLTQTENTSQTDRTCEVTMTQATSGNILKLYVIQGHEEQEDEYQFNIENDGIEDTRTIESASTSTTYSIISTKNGESIPFTASETCDWITVAINGNILTINATENTSTARICVITLTQSESNNTIVITIVQSEGDDEGKTLLLPFDFLTFTFNWNETDGKDLDSATYVLGSHIPIRNNYTLDECPVGYSCRGSNATYKNYVEQYLEHGGDNIQSGDECALVNWKTIVQDSADDVTLQCRLYANWFKEKLNGNCSITFKTYKGEGMEHGTIGNEFIFVPSGNTELVDEKTISGNCNALSAINTGDTLNYYSLIAVFDYDQETKSAIMTNMMNTPSGRELRHFCKLGEDTIEGDGTTTLVGQSSFEYTRVERIVNLPFELYNTVNGVKDAASNYQITIEEGGDFVTTSYSSSNVLTINISENTTQSDRTCVIKVTATCNSSDIKYNIVILQRA